MEGFGVEEACWMRRRWKESKRVLQCAFKLLRLGQHSSACEHVQVSDSTHPSKPLTGYSSLSKPCKDPNRAIGYSLNSLKGVM